MQKFSLLEKPHVQDAGGNNVRTRKGNLTIPESMTEKEDRKLLKIEAKRGSTLGQMYEVDTSVEWISSPHQKLSGEVTGDLLRKASGETELTHGSCFGHRKKAGKISEASG